KVQKNFGHIKMLRESVIYFILNMFLIIAASSQIPSPENFNYSAIIIVLAIIPSVILSIPCYLIVKYKNEKYKKILEDSFSELEFQYDKVVEHYA
ncbi:MAG: hypothetical protein Q3965_05175, partial [Rothia sp. (in: high G+C Gram-positive bacteria)]|nr:hypothetical protein [Rothia sp. (in: high G+C Gram-positive bacteria)]